MSNDSKEFINLFHWYASQMSREVFNMYPVLRYKTPSWEVDQHELKAAWQRLKSRTQLSMRGSVGKTHIFGTHFGEPKRCVHVVIDEIVTTTIGISIETNLEEQLAVMGQNQL